MTQTPSGGEPPSKSCCQGIARFRCLWHASQRGQNGGISQNHWKLINTVLLILPTGAPWRDLPPHHGDWQIQIPTSASPGGVIKEIWDGLLEELRQYPNYEWLMVDPPHCKVHPHTERAKGGNLDRAVTKIWLNTKIHLAVDAAGMPALIIDGKIANCTRTAALIQGVAAKYILADRRHTSDAMVEMVEGAEMQVVIPLHSNRQKQ